MSGVEAFDATDGNLTSRIALRHIPGRLSTRFPTPEDEPFTVVYSVADHAGNAAERIAVQIHVVCPDGQELCPPRGDGHRMCVQAPATRGMCAFAFRTVEDPPEVGDKAAPPSLQLVGPETTELFVGEPYVLCDPNTPGSTVCERGARAYDSVDGDLTSLIMVCCALPPARFMLPSTPPPPPPPRSLVPEPQIFGASSRTDALQSRLYFTAVCCTHSPPPPPPPPATTTRRAREMRKGHWTSRPRRPSYSPPLAFSHVMSTPRPPACTTLPSRFGGPSEAVPAARDCE